MKYSKFFFSFVEAADPTRDFLDSSIMSSIEFEEDAVAENWRTPD
jgi:hypothetical protein